ncbi:MAG: hypothetical protein IJR07_10300 [Bacteroidaceae bacterium]|nr:hypothetical protein [Bacteroidaceae bacterium]
MKRLVFLLTMVVAIASLNAQETRRRERMTPEQFQARQQEYLTKVAELTEQEAKEFFPLYFEMKQKQKAIQDEAWKLFREGKNDNAKEGSYKEINDTFTESQLNSARLEKSYLEQFRKILSDKKIYKIKQAEMGFRTNMVRDMWRPRGEGGGAPSRDRQRRHNPDIKM